MLQKNIKINRPRLFPFAYLIFALAVSVAFYAFSPCDAVVNADADRLEAAGYFSLADHTVDWLAEDTNTIRRANRHSSYLCNNGFMRTFLSVEVFTAASFTDITFIEKNNVPLKLRI